MRMSERPFVFRSRFGGKAFPRPVFVSEPASQQHRRLQAIMAEQKASEVFFGKLTKKGLDVSILSGETRKVIGAALDALERHPKLARDERRRARWERTRTGTKGRRKSSSRAELINSSSARTVHTHGHDQQEQQREHHPHAAGVDTSSSPQSVARNVGNQSGDMSADATVIHGILLDQSVCEAERRSGVWKDWSVRSVSDLDQGIDPGADTQSPNKSGLQDDIINDLRDTGIVSGACSPDAGAGAGAGAGEPMVPSSASRKDEDDGGRGCHRSFLAPNLNTGLVAQTLDEIAALRNTIRRSAGLVSLIPRHIKDADREGESGCRESWVDVLTMISDIKAKVWSRTSSVASEKSDSNDSTSDFSDYDEMPGSTPRSSTSASTPPGVAPDSFMSSFVEAMTRDEYGAGLRLRRKILEEEKARLASMMHSHSRGSRTKGVTGGGALHDGPQCAEAGRGEGVGDSVVAEKNRFSEVLANRVTYSLPGHGSWSSAIEDKLREEALEERGYRNVGPSRRQGAGVGTMMDGEGHAGRAEWNLSWGGRGVGSEFRNDGDNWGGEPRFRGTGGSLAEGTFDGGVLSSVLDRALKAVKNHGCKSLWRGKEEEKKKEEKEEKDCVGFASGQVSSAALRFEAVVPPPSRKPYSAPAEKHFDLAFGSAETPLRHKSVAMDLHVRGRIDIKSHDKKELKNFSTRGSSCELVGHVPLLFQGDVCKLVSAALEAEEGNCGASSARGVDALNDRLARLERMERERRLSASDRNVLEYFTSDYSPPVSRECSPPVARPDAISGSATRVSEPAARPSAPWLTPRFGSASMQAANRSLSPEPRGPHIMAPISVEEDRRGRDRPSAPIRRRPPARSGTPVEKTPRGGAGQGNLFARGRSMSRSRGNFTSHAATRGFGCQDEDSGGLEGVVIGIETLPLDMKRITPSASRNQSPCDFNRGQSSGDADVKLEIVPLARRQSPWQHARVTRASSVSPPKGMNLQRGKDILEELRMYAEAIAVPADSIISTSQLQNHSMPTSSASASASASSSSLAWRRHASAPRARPRPLAMPHGNYPGHGNVARARSVSPPWHRSLGYIGGFDSQRGRDGREFGGTGSMSSMYDSQVVVA